MEEVNSVESGYSDSTSPISEAPPDVRNWFSSYVYDSSLPSEPPDIVNWFSSYVYESPMLDTNDGLDNTENIDRNNVSPPQQLVSSSAKSQLLLSEPPDVRNWFSSYEYQSPQLELGFCSSQKDQLIIDESETEEKYSFGIFRKTNSKQETIPSNDYKKNIPSDKAKEISEMEKKSSVRLFSASENGLMSTSKGDQKACFVDENLKSIDQESDDKENDHRKRTESGFVTIQKARDRRSVKKPSRGVLVERSTSKKYTEEEEEEEQRKKKKRRVLGEMSNHQFSGGEEIRGKWLCPQKKKGKLVPPLKQLRLDTWVHKA